MAGYFDYYARAIANHASGLKLVGGGTGLGKTSHIPEVVMRAIPPERKAIYVANRIELLKEMEGNMDDPEAVIMLPRDLEAVRLTLKNHRHDLDELISDRSKFSAHAKQMAIGKEVCRSAPIGWK
ncbi:MAG: hypothetical protein ACOYLB_17315, partial [Phototrophicaceae bacterium]